MKVVLFCGGLGMRMRSGPESLPKPMMPVGNRPVLWHLMRYYAHYGHTEFVICLGFGAKAVKDYFLDYRETESNDFVLSKGGGARRAARAATSATGEITFIDTGLDTPIGERLRRVRPYLEEDEVFLANYGDVLTDAPMDELVDEFLATDAVGQLLAVKPQDSFHVVRLGGDGDLVTGFQPAGDMNLRINGGFFVLRTDIFDYLYEGEDLVMDGCRRAAERGGCERCPTTGSGRRWTRSRSAPTWRTSTAAAGRRGPCGATASHLGGSPRSRFPTSRRSRAPSHRDSCVSSRSGPETSTCSAWARTPTTSRSVAAQRCSCSPSHARRGSRTCS